VFERYTEAARRVLFFARYEAGQLGVVSVASEHLLLGLMRETEGIASQVFARSRLSLEDIKKEIEGRTGREQDSPPDENHLGAEAKRILQLATEEADRLLHHNIGPEHLLLGLLRAERSTAASILMAHGMRLNSVRDDIVLTHSQGLAGPRFDDKRHSEVRRHVATRPDLPRSFGVQIAPTKRGPGESSDQGGVDYWVLEGFDLKTALSRVFASDEMLFPETRIELPASLDPRTRYDFFLVLAPNEGHEKRNRLMQQGIEAYFRVSIAHESRPMDVYVLTAPDGQSPAVRDSQQFGGAGMSSASFAFALPDFDDGPPTIESFQARFPTSELLWKAVSDGSIGGMSVSNGTMEGFCHILEQGLDRPVVDETGLNGRYDIELQGDSASTSEFLQRLHRQLGLALTLGRRDVTMLVVRQD
jgi:uncharacterized protein (TIGR03435 family)